MVESVSILGENIFVRRNFFFYCSRTKQFKHLFIYLFILVVKPRIFRKTNLITILAKNTGKTKKKVLV